MNPVHTSNFLPAVDADAVQRLRQVRRRLPGRGDDVSSRRTTRTSRRRKQAKVDEDLCLGLRRLRAHVRAGRLGLRRVRERVITPVNSVHRTVAHGDRARQAAEPHLRQHALANHRAMATVLGVILGCRRSSRPWPASNSSPSTSTAYWHGRNDTAARDYGWPHHRRLITDGTAPRSGGGPAPAAPAEACGPRDMTPVQGSPWCRHPPRSGA